MKYSNTTIRELTAQYSRILRKCALLNAALLLSVAFAVPAMAAETSFLAENNQELSGNYTNYVNTNSTLAGVATIDYGTSGVTVAEGTVFDDNETQKSAGGAIKALNGMTIGNDVTFSNNKATGNAWGGGALYVKLADKETASGNTTVSIGSGAKFTGNDGALFGGAIALEEGNVVIGRADGEQTVFADNKAGVGGAIYAWKDDEHGDLTSSLKLTNVVFDANEALDRTSVDSRAIGYGGAVAFVRSGEVTIQDSSFDGNKAVEGGAIFAQGKLNPNVEPEDADFAVVKIDNTEFKGNQATGDEEVGGAISAGRNSKFVISNSTFTGNTAAYSGAIFTYSPNITTYGSKGGILDITNTIFEENTALGAGAVQAMAEASIKNSVFKKNHASTDSDGAGAIFVGAKGKVTIDNTVFEENTAGARGGAISTRSADLANNEEARLDILNSTFIKNTAGTTGGAFDNYLYDSTTALTASYIGNSTFTENGADKGGAVYNHGALDKGNNIASLKIENATFTGNTATTAGGAIYNEEQGTMYLAGTNTFSGNTAGGVANDIHNDGNLNIAGDITLDGGISGTGSVVFKEGSSLTITLQTTTILANSVTTNGANLNLSIANGMADGTYDFVKAGTPLDQSFNIGANTLYDIRMNNAGQIELAKKSTDTITGTLTAAGASSNEAAAIVAMSSVSLTGNAQVDAVLSQITAAAQSGNVETASAIVESIHPTEAPVMQSVSTNTAVLGAVVNRLAAIGGGAPVAAQGRSGGDVVSKLSPWIQGLYNKTHNSQGVGFDAYSQGFAFGADTDLTDAWTIGLGYAYTATDIKNSVHKTQVYGDNYFIYGQYKPSAWYINGVVNYGHSNYKETGALTSRYNIDTYGAQVMTGYQWDILDNYAGVRYTYIDTDRYNNGLTEVDTKNAQIATAVIGTKVSKDFTPAKGVILTPEFRLAGTYDFKAENSKATIGIMGSTASYTIENRRLHRAAVETGVGLTASIRNLELSANYDASLRSESNTQAVNLKAIYHF